MSVSLCYVSGTFCLLRVTEILTSFRLSLEFEMHLLSIWKPGTLRQIVKMRLALLLSSKYLWWQLPSNQLAVFSQRMNTFDSCIVVFTEDLLVVILLFKYNNLLHSKYSNGKQKLFHRNLWKVNKIYFIYWFYQHITYTVCHPFLWIRNGLDPFSIFLVWVGALSSLWCFDTFGWVKWIASEKNLLQFSHSFLVGGSPT